jgi:hypothetical protein
VLAPPGSGHSDTSLGVLPQGGIDLIRNGITVGKKRFFTRRAVLSGVDGDRQAVIPKKTDACGGGLVVGDRLLIARRAAATQQ